MIHYNVSSLILGLLSWGTGIWGIVKKRKVCFPSFTACALSLLFQLLEIRRLAEVGDSSAIYDTIGAVSLAAIVLVAGTVVTNLAALFRGRK